MLRSHLENIFGKCGTKKIVNVKLAHIYPAGFYLKKNVEDISLMCDLAFYLQMCAKYNTEYIFVWYCSMTNSNQDSILPRFALIQKR